MNQMEFTIYKGSSSIPVNIHIVRSFNTGPTARFNLRPTLRPNITLWPAVTPTTERSTETPFHKEPAVTPAIKRPIWDFLTPSYQEPTHRTFFNIPTIRQRWELKPPDNDHKPRGDVSTSNGSHSSFNLENLLWVALGGIVALALIAILMKIGNPVRRVRRQRYAQRATVVTTRRRDPDNRNLDMGSLLRLTDTDTEPFYDDSPPPYSVCVPKINKRDTEEPPPRFSACFVTYTNSKDAEPKVHIAKKKVIFENDLRAVSNAMNESEDVGDTRTELVLVNGRIVEKPKLNLNGNNNETVFTTNDNTEKHTTKHTDQKGIVVRVNPNDNVDISSMIY